MIDDPTLTVFDGKTLIGSYDIDDEGVRAEKVSVIENGELINYLVGREPIRDFPESNGHGRAAPAQAPTPNMGNLIVSSKQALSPDDIKKKLIEICRQENKPYGYRVETLAGYSPQASLPRIREGWPRRTRPRRGIQRTGHASPAQRFDRSGQRRAGKQPRRPDSDDGDQPVDIIRRD